MRKVGSRTLAFTLIISLFFTLLPISGTPKAAAAGNVEIRFFNNMTLIGNASHDGDNAFIHFDPNRNVPGFYSQQADNTKTFYGSGDVWTPDDEDEPAQTTFTLKVAENPQLKTLAESGEAEVVFGWKRLPAYDTFWWDRNSGVVIEIEGKTEVKTVVNVSTSGGNSIGARTFDPIKLKWDDVIKITVRGSGFNGDGPHAGVEGFFIKFQDKTPPKLNDYTFTGNGAERMNEKIGQKELYVRANQNITLSYNFSEPVYSHQLSLTPNQSDYFLRHPLFVNRGGTGLPAAGQTQYLKNVTYTSGNLNKLFNQITYKYEGVRYHDSSNRPLEPKIRGPKNADANDLEQTLEQKFKDAVLIDAAGNVADLSGMSKAGPGSNNHLGGLNTHPFDYANGGYRVIVDAVDPKYTKLGNGIQPEILTGVVLNKNDKIEFTVQLTEEAIVKDAWKQDVNKTYLLFNNGMKAKYVNGYGSDNWKFQLDIKGVPTEEVPLLKVIALTHEFKEAADPDSDKSVLQDYAGNLLTQPANFDGEHVNEEGEDASLLNSKIDWAKLQIDNTNPVIGYRFENGGADDATYRQNGKVTIDANDPDLVVPGLDPVAVDRNQPRPSKGIYRPSNMTGSTAPAVGLVYYYWSQSAADPFAGMEADNFAAVKRFSLSARQPGDGLYPTGFENVTLRVANNKTNMIAPPAEALLEDGSGDWYLHAWTADMTWDSARELMQYDKAKSYIADHPDEYAAWLEEAPGTSPADKKVYADNKALNAVGQYGDLNIWTPADFKREDSNWTYNKTVFKLDNKAPVVDTANLDNNNSPVVTASLKIAEAHSGLASAKYQWVSDGGSPGMDWTDAGGIVTGDPSTGYNLQASTLNHVYEDGMYWLYVDMVDNAGNERVVKVDAAAIVDSTSRVTASFDPASPADFVKSHDVVFRVKGIEPASVTEATYGSDVGYNIGMNPVPPTADAAYTPLVPFHVDDSDPLSKEAFYRIAADPLWAGTLHFHVKVKEPSGITHYYTRTYKFDNVPPLVSFSKTEVAYPLPAHELTVGVSENYAVAGLVKKYQWLREGDAEPMADSAGWLDLPDVGNKCLGNDPLVDEWKDYPNRGNVCVNNKLLAAGEIVDFILYVYAKDGAGNETVVKTGKFKLSKAGSPDTPPATAKSDLIYLYGDEEDGYTAIVKLDLDTVDKTGYEVSVSPDNGASWVKWRPYTNFIAVKVPTNVPEQLKIQVKFRTPGGRIGDPKTLNIGNLSEDQPVYALATLGTTRPVSPTKGVDIVIAPPLGVKIAPSSVNPSAPLRAGNTFRVFENGYYSFDLTDLSDSSRKDTLFVVVHNIDGTAPEGSIEFVTEGGAAPPAKTNGSVSVRLNTSEPVKVVNNGGRSVYTFTQNGTFTFEFQDEAGNIGTATAEVDIIDKEAPRVQIVRSYAYGADFSKLFGTIRDGSNVLYAQGVTLSVEKADPDAKNFVVLEANPYITLTANGKASFRIADEYGNTTRIEEVVDNLIAVPPQPASVTYTFADDDGNPLTPNKIVTIGGKKYAKGKVKVTLTGQTIPANLVFAGVVPVQQGGAYTNQISDEDGAFEYEKLYSADGTSVIAISDLLGNVNRIPVTVSGLDNKGPELTLHHKTIAVAQNKADFDFRKDLGGFSVSDNVSKPEHIAVAISGLDLSRLGRQTVTYTAVDQVGNETVVHQDVVVMATDGILIFANGVLISGSSAETALFDTNRLTFSITRYNLMNVAGQERENEWGTYDIFYQQGLYREGQMKMLAEKLTLKELQSRQFTHEFKDVGWYTLIVRNQERERDFAMFFVSGKE